MESPRRRAGRAPPRRDSCHLCTDAGPGVPGGGRRGGPPVWSTSRSDRALRHRAGHDRRSLGRRRARRIRRRYSLSLQRTRQPAEDRRLCGRPHRRLHGRSRRSRTHDTRSRLRLFGGGADHRRWTPLGRAVRVLGDHLPFRSGRRAEIGRLHEARCARPRERRGTPANDPPGRGPGSAAPRRDSRCILAEAGAGLCGGRRGGRAAARSTGVRDRAIRRRGRAHRRPMEPW